VDGVTTVWNTVVTVSPGTISGLVAMSQVHVCSLSTPAGIDGIFVAMNCACDPDCSDTGKLPISGAIDTPTQPAGSTICCALKAVICVGAPTLRIENTIEPPEPSGIAGFDCAV
jgi:hypothetical protein